MHVSFLFNIMHILNGVGFEFQSIIILQAHKVNPASATAQTYRIDTKVSGRQHCASIMSWRAPERPAPVQKVSCMIKSWLENFLFIHENENFAPGMILSPQKCSWVVGLYTTSCTEFSTNEHFYAKFSFP